MFAISRHHAVARGWAGPSLLAMIMLEKFGQRARVGYRIPDCASEVCSYLTTGVGALAGHKASDGHCRPPMR